MNNVGLLLGLKVMRPLAFTIWELLSIEKWTINVGSVTAQKENVLIYVRILTLQEMVTLKIVFHYGK